MSRESEPKSAGVSVFLVALVPLACCAGLPLLLAAGVSAGLAIALGGALIGGLVLIGALGLLAVQIRRKRAANYGVPTQRIGGSA